MARFSVCKIYMPMHDDRRWWSCGEASCNDSDISVTDRVPCSEIVHNAKTEALGSENLLGPIVD